MSVCDDCGKGGPLGSMSIVKYKRLLAFRMCDTCYKDVEPWARTKTDILMYITERLELKANALLECRRKILRDLERGNSSTFLHNQKEKKTIQDFFNPDGHKVRIEVSAAVRKIMKKSEVSEAEAAVPEKPQADSEGLAPPTRPSSKS